MFVQRGLYIEQTPPDIESLIEKLGNLTNLSRKGSPQTGSITTSTSTISVCAHIGVASSIARRGLRQDQVLTTLFLCSITYLAIDSHEHNAY